MCRIIPGLKSITARIAFSVRCAATVDAHRALNKKVKNTEPAAVKKRKRASLTTVDSLLIIYGNTL
jgi:hypothetical protein